MFNRQIKNTLLLFLVTISVSYSQQINSDSLNVLSQFDSSFVSLKHSADSTKKKTFDVDEVIITSATDSIRFDLISKKMFIYGKGELKYKQTNLEGGQINIDFENNDLEALGIKDTSDTASVSGFMQTPVLTEGAEVYEGTKLKYNIKTQKGFISAAKNVKESTKYQGSAVSKVNKDTYFVKDGIYTTCASDTPHTYFGASEMKVVQKDKIFAKWIFMYIGGVPLPIPIPFAVFPTGKGRRSGIIAPTYGKISNRGHFFRNFGYFFAINDYMDLTLKGDYYTRGGWGTNARYRYVKRYNYNGSLTASYSKILVGEDKDPSFNKSTDWKLALSHNQNFSPTMRLTANLSFQSGSYNKNNTFTFNEFVKKNIVSNATFNKRWDGSGNSMTISYNRTQDLESGDIRETLPNVSFNKSRFYPFKSSTSSFKDQGWYEQIGVNYSGNFKNLRNKIDNELKIRGGIQHNVSVSASPKIGFFNISPSLNYVEKWYNKKTNRYVETIQDISHAQMFFKSFSNSATRDTVVDEDVHDINMLRTFNLSLAASTKIYGMMQPKMFGVDAFRHTLKPSISYNYNPDFSEDKWGYYDSYVDTSGNDIRYDPYAKEIFSGVSSGESQSINFRLGNVFEIKTMKDPTDTTSKAKKITLLNLDFSTGYNFAADSVKLSDLNVSFRTKIGSYLDFSGSSRYTFYEFNGTRKVNEFLYTKGKGLFRLRNLNFNVSTSLSGDKLAGEKRTGKKENEEEYDSFKKDNNSKNYEDEINDFSIPWNLGLNYRFNLAKPTPAESRITSNVGINLSFNLAKNWKFGVRSNYDFQRDEFIAPQITVYRDLECWEIDFSWNPIGSFTGFRFEIRMKAPELRDVKVTRRRGSYSGR